MSASIRGLSWDTLCLVTLGIGLAVFGLGEQLCRLSVRMADQKERVAMNAPNEPVFLHQPWREFEREQRYDRQIQFLKGMAWGFVCTIIAVILGEVFL
jgi:hypothetical protein